MDKITCSNCNASNSIKAKYCSACGYEMPKANAEIIKEPILEEKKKTKSKLTTGTILGVIVSVLAVNIVQKYMFTSPSYDKALMECASELNKTCPVNVDAETRLDNAVALPGRIFQYNYTLVNMDKANIDTIVMKKTLEPNIINYVKTNPQMAFQRKNKTIVNYYYKDKSGQYICMITVSPDKYE